MLWREGRLDALVRHWHIRRLEEVQLAAFGREVAAIQMINKKENRLTVCHQNTTEHGAGG